MLLKRLHPVLLALTLLTGQWLALAHAAEHDLLAPDVHCQICAHAPGVDSAVAASPPPALHLTSFHEAPQRTGAPAAHSCALHKPHIRGPPQTL